MNKMNMTVMACTFPASSCYLSGALLDDFPMRVESLKASGKNTARQRCSSNFCWVVGKPSLAPLQSWPWSPAWKDKTRLSWWNRWIYVAQKWTQDLRQRTWDLAMCDERYSLTASTINPPPEFGRFATSASESFNLNLGCQEIRLLTETRTGILKTIRLIKKRLY